MKGLSSDRVHYGWFVIEIGALLSLFFLSNPPASSKRQEGEDPRSSCGAVK